MTKEEALEFIRANIDKPGQTQEILKLIQDIPLDCNDNDFQYELSIYFTAVIQGNLVLLQKLIEHNLVDVNSQSKDGEPILYRLASMYQDEKHSEILEYLLSLSELDVEATSNQGISGGALFYQKKMIPHAYRITQREKPNSLTNQLIRTKLLLLTFGLDDSKDVNFDIGTTEYLMPKGSLGALPLINLHQSFSEYQYSQHFGSLEESVVKAVNQSKQSEFFFESPNFFGAQSSENQKCLEEAIEAYSQGKAVSIQTGWQGHAVTLVFCEDTLYICNKGQGKHPNYAVAEYKIHHTEEVTNLFLPLLKRDERELIETEIHSKLGTELKGGLTGKAQYMGNCTLASPKKGIHALIYHHIKKIKPELGEEEQKVLAEQFYKNWTRWDRQRSLEKFIQASEGRDTQFFSSILDNLVFSTSRFSEGQKPLIEKLILHSKAKSDRAFLQQLEEFTNNIFIEKLLSKIVNAKGEVSPVTIALNFISFLRVMGKDDLLEQLPLEMQLLYAIVLNNENKAIKLINHPEIDMQYRTQGTKKTGFSFAHAASICKQANVLRALVEKEPTLLNAKTSNNFTPLHSCVAACDANMSSTLLSLGADWTLPAGSKSQFAMDDLLKRSTSEVNEVVKPYLSPSKRSKKL